MEAKPHLPVPPSSETITFYIPSTEARILHLRRPSSTRPTHTTPGFKLDSTELPSNDDTIMKRPHGHPSVRTKAAISRCSDRQLPGTCARKLLTVLAEMGLGPRQTASHEVASASTSVPMVIDP